MKLYSIQVVSGTPSLVEANVVRDTKLFYFVDNTRVTQWSSRIEKRFVDVKGNPYGNSLVATTPLLAWEIFQGNQRIAQDKALEVSRRCSNNLQVAQLAVDDIRAAEKNGERFICDSIKEAK